MQTAGNRTNLLVFGVAALVLLGLGTLVVQRALAQDLESRKVRYVIPPGTDDLILAGEDPRIVPATIKFTLGETDILVVSNLDDVGHTFGPYYVAAGDELEVQFFRPATYEGYCSVHPSNSLVIEVYPGSRGPLGLW